MTERLLSTASGQAARESLALLPPSFPPLRFRRFPFPPTTAGVFVEKGDVCVITLRLTLSLHNLLNSLRTRVFPPERLKVPFPPAPSLNLNSTTLVLDCAVCSTSSSTPPLSSTFSFSTFRFQSCRGRHRRRIERRRERHSLRRRPTAQERDEIAFLSSCASLSLERNA
jgi:hypothetical protein